jgi:hypothetical protein
MSILEQRSPKYATATVNANQEYYRSVGLHQQCRLVYIDKSEITYYHYTVGEMKFDYDTFTPQLLKEKIDELLQNI